MPTRITLANGEPMGLAGLWAQWRYPSVETVHSFTMLTINADEHPMSISVMSTHVTSAYISCRFVSHLRFLRVT